MNIVSRLTLRHLEENKKRTVVTILGIAASTALITTMLVGVTSFFAFFGRVALNASGDWHGEFDDLTLEQIESLKEDDRIRTVAITRTDGITSGVRLKTDTPDRLRTGNTLIMDAQGIYNKVVCDYDGVLPQNSNEIAVEEKFLKYNNIDAKPGDSITVDIGSRYILDGDGNKVILGGNYHSNEGFDFVSEETYTITAILHDNTATEGFDFLNCLNEGDVPKENFVDICLKKFDHTAHKQLRAIAKDHNLTLTSINTEYLVSVFSYNKGSRGVTSIIPVGIVALLIIMGTSVVLIYNAFGMSLTERMRYLGMLASVGATRKQKRASIYFEALILGIIGIPLGIIIGLLGAFFTIGVLGRTMLSAGMIVGAEGLADYVPVSAPLFVYVFIVLISAVTIFISALVPAIRASRIMPIDALRQNNSIKVRARKLKVNPIIRKLFGYEGELAYKNIKRNGSKGTIITISIIASVVMFLTITNFSQMFEKANSVEFNIPYQLYVSCSVQDSDRLKQELSENDLVDRCYVNDMYNYSFKPDQSNPKYIPANDDILDEDYLNKGYRDIFDARQFFVSTIEDADFEKLLEDNGISKDAYFGDELVGVILNDYYRQSSRKAVFNQGIIGQVLHYDKEEGNPPKIRIGAMVTYDKNNYIFDLVPKNAVVIYVPESVFNKKYEENLGSDIATKTIAIETKKTTKLYDELGEMLERGDYHNYTYGNMEQSLGAFKAVLVILKTVMYGFTTLITLIVLANMVNTISTGIILRRKEFAMLRSIGMTGQGFKKMISLETVLYGVRSLVVGIPLSLLLSYYMTKAANSEMAFEVNIFTYLVVIAAVFVIIGTSMIMSVSRIKNDEIIEVLKEDIC